LTENSESPDFAINIAGAIAVPILPNFSKSEVEKILEHSEAKCIFVNEANAFKVAETKVKRIRLEEINSILPSSMEIETLKNHAPEENDIASIIYTSGTTGTPKGVMLKQQNLSNFYNSMKNTIEYLKNTEKYTYDLKKNINLLNNINLNTSFDLMIAAYLLNYQIKEDLGVLMNKEGIYVPFYSEVIKNKSNIEILFNILFSFSSKRCCDRYSKTLSTTCTKT